MAEVAVHLSLSFLPKYYAMVEINIPESIATASPSVKKLRVNWNGFPHLIPTVSWG